jgi:CO/xanthine dehydrogenase Mo-binding subunit
MRFDTPANPIDRGRVVGRPHDGIDGPATVTGTAPYAYEWHDEVPDAAYGWVVGSTIACGRIARIDARAALAAPGVIAATVAGANATVLKHAVLGIAGLEGECLPQRHAPRRRRRSSCWRPTGRPSRPRLGKAHHDAVERDAHHLAAVWAITV